MADKPLEHLPISLTGRWRPATDGTLLGEGDFQTLTNMRYKDVGIKSISGMTKINSSVINATNLKTRAAFHYKKATPNAESHVLAQSWNAGETSSSVYENTTAIPSAGNFTATALHADSSGAGYGRFSKAPEGCVAYCNGVDAMIWGGNEFRVGSFIFGDLGLTSMYDYTNVVNNSLTDTNNIATVYRIDGSLDANTLALWKFENNANDSTTNGHNLTAANMTYDSSVYKFGAYSANLNGTNGSFSIADHADFDLSGGVWTIDFWIRKDADEGGPIYYQGTDASNYMSIYLSGGVSPTYNGQSLTLKIVAAASTVVSLTAGACIFNSTWTHVAIVENGNNYYIFINGDLLASTTDTDRPANYTGSVYIGTDGSTQWIDGRLDEFRISDAARWTSAFTPPSLTYGGQTYESYLYLASIRPISGVKFYIGTANDTAGTATCQYWDGGAWTTVSSLVDGTSASAKTLAQTGSITFTSTVTTAKLRHLFGQLAYWYRFTFTNLDTTTTISQCSLNCPFQPIVDIWDGIPRSIVSGLLYSSSYKDYTINLISEDYDSSDDITYMDISSLTTAGYIIVGFSERMLGLDVGVVHNKNNTNAGTVTVSYWSGTGFTACSNINDGTTDGPVTMGKAGIITWAPVTEINEFKTTFSGEDMWYYYKISFSATLSANCYIDYIYGIPAQRTIRGYKFPVYFQDRLLLCCEKSQGKNKILMGNSGSSVVFNGTDTKEITIGDDSEIVSAVPVYTRWSGDIYENLIIGKASGQICILDGTTVDTFKIFTVGEINGVCAPNSMISCPLGYELASGINKHVVIWQGSTGIYAFDGNTVFEISADIENYFNPEYSECIDNDYVHKSVAFYDERRQEYHLLIASGSSSTALNTELVYDLVRKKWFKIDRGANDLQFGISVTDTNGDKYCYGFIDTGYMERLEYGTTIDGTNITSTWKLGDYALKGLGYRTQIRKVKHVAVAKTTTTNTASLVHYLDTSSTATSTETCTVNASGKRIASVTKSVDWGPGVFHSIQGSLVTSNETVGYEPIGIGIFYQIVGEDIR